MRSSRLRSTVQACAVSGPTRTSFPLRDRPWTSACLQGSATYHHEARPYLARKHRPSLSQRARIQERRFLSATSTETPKLSHQVPADFRETQQLIDTLYTTVSREPSLEGLPDEHEVLDVLHTYRAIADKYSQSQERQVSGQRVTGGSVGETSAMLEAMNKDRSEMQVSSGEILDNIATKAAQLVELPAILITADILKAYIELQAHLGRPQDFPTVFDIYRNKPSPRPSDEAPYITFANATPNAHTVAIDPDVAETALTAAIKYHSLPLAISTIESTYCHPSYTRFKIIKSAIIPVAGLAIAPIAAYALSSNFALIQNSMDPSHAMTVAMAGMTTYLAVVGSMGYITITTANDQMVRVTWASGMPLWERWVREEERAAVDKIAQAWGFRNRTKWGDEEGAEWDMLREWAGVRGMVLDKVEFMQGMQ